MTIRNDNPNDNLDGNPEYNPITTDQSPVDNLMSHGLSTHHNSA
jgi:hypothetical protein